MNRLNFIVKPALRTCGFHPVRADEIGEPGLISVQIMHHLIYDPLVVADLTGQDGNVMYELGIRHLVRKPFVQIAEKGETLPFDLKDIRTIFIDSQTVSGVVEGQQQIVTQVESALANPDGLVTPVSVAFLFACRNGIHVPARRRPRRSRSS